MNFDILFENKNLIAIDKPCGFLSVPSRWGDKDQRPCLGTILQKALGAQIFPIHRLDEETTGVILYSKSKELHKILNAAFEKHQLVKIYQALCEKTGSAPNLISGEYLKAKLLRGKKRTYISPVGQHAETLIEKYCLIENKYHGYELKPLTGRSHQLRFQLSSKGYPILGDLLYGSKIVPYKNDVVFPKSSICQNGIALRAISLDLSPIKNQVEKFGLPLVFQVAQKLF
jgi:tRNA pseudouridine32 synthase/23S rRNA pseudouridine746 synthase